MVVRVWCGSLTLQAELKAIGGLHVLGAIVIRGELRVLPRRIGLASSLHVLHLQSIVFLFSKELFLIRQAESRYRTMSNAKWQGQEMEIR